MSYIKYRPEFCEELVKFSKKGKTLAQFAASINCSQAAVNKWARDFPEFGEAKQIARTNLAALAAEKYEDARTMVQFERSRLNLYNYDDEYKSENARFAQKEDTDDFSMNIQLAIQSMTEHLVEQMNIIQKRKDEELLIEKEERK